MWFRSCIFSTSFPQQLGCTPRLRHSPAAGPQPCHRLADRLRGTASRSGAEEEGESQSAFGVPTVAVTHNTTELPWQSPHEPWTFAVSTSAKGRKALPNIGKALLPAHPIAAQPSLGSYVLQCLTTLLCLWIHTLALYRQPHRKKSLATVPPDPSPVAWVSSR